MTRGTREPERRSRILIGVTARSSVGLLAGMPERLDKEGWEVHLVSAPSVAGTGSARFQASVPEAILVHDLPMERDPSPHRDLASLFQWLRLLRRVRPDVVYVGTPKAGLLGIVASRLMRVPIRIYIARGLRAETARGVKRRILVLAEKVTMRLATHRISVSGSLARELKRLTGIPSRVIGPGSSNGIDLNRFAPRLTTQERSEERAALGVSDGALLVGFVGRISRDKGVGQLLAALKLLSDRGAPIELMVVGGREDAGYFDTELAQLADRIYHVGRVPDTRPYYELMDVFALPTRREGFANVLLEAAAMQVPIVSTRATGVVDFVEDGVTGLLVSPDSADELAEAIERLHADPALAKELVANARSRVNAYEREHIQSLYASFIRAAAKTRNATP